MTRKVFMSVLGATNYQECQYVEYQTGFKSSKTRFIQVTMFEKFVREWTANDIAYILLTSGKKGSEMKNWFDNGHCKYGTEELIVSTGLHKLLANMNLPCRIEPVYIKNGDDENEIWENFRTIFDCLKPNDEVYFDITHGFRSLPMLVLVLNNYSKFLKDIKIASITYGNYEARNELNEAPIIDLTSLSELQDWTAAANMFITTGNTKSITELLKNEDIKSLNDFVDEINECRGLEIYNGKSAINLKNNLKKFNVHNNSFKELLDKIGEKVDHFEPNDIVNGFRAVDFCIQHQLIQQGVTILQEFIISFILKEINYENWLHDFERTIVSGCMSINNLRCFKPSEKSEEEKLKSLEIAQKVFSLPYKKKLSDRVFKGLAHGARNDLNHGGKRNDPKPTGYFGEKLTEYFNNTLEILSIKL